MRKRLFRELTAFIAAICLTVGLIPACGASAADAHEAERNLSAGELFAGDAVAADNRPCGAEPFKTVYEIIETDDTLPEAGTLDDGGKPDGGRLRAFAKAPNAAPPTYIPPEGGGVYGYNTLDETGKALYREIAAVVEQFAEADAVNPASAQAMLTAKDMTATVKDSLTVNIGSDTGIAVTAVTVFDVVEIFVFDNPEYYWLDTMVSASGTGTKVTKISLVIRPEFVSPESRARYNTLIFDTVDDWIDDFASIPAMTGTDYDKVLYAHDLLTYHTFYAYDRNGEPSVNDTAHTMAGVFDGSGVVCEGYARAFQYMMNRFGIDNTYILGWGGGGYHAWNSVCLDGEYYLVDVTWDDRDNDISGPPCLYTYLCLPGSLFGKTHAVSTDSLGSYPQPEFADNEKYIYSDLFGSRLKEPLTSGNIAAFTEAAEAGKCPYSDYVYLTFPYAGGNNNAQVLATYFNERYIVTYDAYVGMTYAYRASASSAPFETVGLTYRYPGAGESIALDPEAGDPLKLTAEGAEREAVVSATLTPDTGDCIIWSVSAPTIVSLRLNGNRLTSSGRLAREITLCGLRDGKAVVTATSWNDPSKYIEFTVAVGTGVEETECELWQNGSKLNKSCTLIPGIKATNWTDTRGRSKTGKLVWVSTKNASGVTFDKTRHTVTTRSDKTVVSVSSKGVVTAKKAGTAYVYCCDTGSCTYEMFTVTVFAAPTKLTPSVVAGSPKKEEILKKVTLDVGETKTVYICPYIKDGSVDPGCTYSLSFAKEEYAAYAMLGRVQKTASGYPYFTITAAGFDSTKNKPATIKVNITNDQSGKKTSVTVVIDNSVKAIAAAAGDSAADLSTKGATYTINYSLDTAMGADLSTTDKLKVWVGRSSVTLSDKRITADRGATVKAKLNVNDGTITLTASKDAAVPAVIYIAATDTVTHAVTLYAIATVNEAGTVTLK